MNTHTTINEIETSILHRKRISNKKFLNLVYEEWSEILVNNLEKDSGCILEIGSGGGFIDKYHSKTIKSDIVLLPWVDVVLDAQLLPFQESKLNAMVMVNVFHHIPNPRIFLEEASRCIAPNGFLLMIEPWVTAWSNIFYKHFHHEPFNPVSKYWDFQSNGRLSSANGALPWIVFNRDRAVFESEFPYWRIDEVYPFMPFRYILSGGVSTDLSIPAWTFGFWKWLEKKLELLSFDLGMFAFIKLIRI